jgi:alpha-glucosidase
LDSDSPERRDNQAMATEQPWWRNAVIYQVYVRSFADGNGDGTGDISGLRSRLPYIESLGVDGIWVNPWYVSPLHDGGYDVADYRKIDPVFGTIDEAKLLMDEAAEQGLRVLVDLVPNHTSSEHRWFREAVASPPGSASRTRYHILAGQGDGGSEPPNDWRSVFGGPAWTRLADGEWYLHLFDSSQPDLNWANPEVKKEFVDILRFWLDLGAAGFRVDVAHALDKDSDYSDVGDSDDHFLESRYEEMSPIWDREPIHELVAEWRSVLDEYPDKVMIAEAWTPSWERLARYIRPGEYHQAFDFEFLVSPWDASEMRGRIDTALVSASEVGSVPTWVLSNHDVVRHTTRYGLPQDINSREWLLGGDRSLLDEDLGLRRARAAAMLMLALPGSVYLYQGEELGLPEAYDLPFEEIQDPVWMRSGYRAKGRDGCRVPLPWNLDGRGLGFSDAAPWLPQPESWGQLSVEAQEGDPGSTLVLYRQAIAIRSDLIVGAGELEWLDGGDSVIKFRRGENFECIVNFRSQPIAIGPGTVVLSSSGSAGRLVPPDGAVWVEKPR